MIEALQDGHRLSADRSEAEGITASFRRRIPVSTVMRITVARRKRLHRLAGPPISARVARIDTPKPSIYPTPDAVASRSKTASELIHSMLHARRRVKTLRQCLANGFEYPGREIQAMGINQCFDLAPSVSSAQASARAGKQ